LLRGDVEKLRSVFDSHAIVVGEIHQQPYYKTIEAYLDGVASRQSPEKFGERVRQAGEWRVITKSLTHVEE
jgi:hypothetical protein